MIRVITPQDMLESLKERPRQIVISDEDTFDAIYVEPSYALYELSQRTQDLHLKQNVRKYLNAESTGLLNHFSLPRAVLFRQIATPTHEVLRFLRMAHQMSLSPFLFEYYGDKFVSAGNTYKRALGKMPIYQYTGTDGRDMVKYHSVLDFNAYTGKNLSDIPCMSGESLIEFHHRLLNRIGKIQPKKYCYDATSWLTNNGGVATSYYESFLTLFVRDGILFESFENTPTVRQFFRDTMLPAFHAVEARFGMRPLIVRLLPHNQELRPFWDSYPKKIEQYL